MADRGKLLIAAMFAVAIVAAVFGLWFVRQQRQVALEFWGARAGVVVRDAEQVALARLEPVGATADDVRVRVSDQSYRESVSRSISGVPGLIKLRLALLENRAFDASTPTPPTTEWKYLLQFGERDELVTVLIDSELQRLRYHERGREAGVSEISSYLRHFVSDHLPPEQEGGAPE